MKDKHNINIYLTSQSYDDRMHTYISWFCWANTFFRSSHIYYHSSFSSSLLYFGAIDKYLKPLGVRMLWFACFEIVVSVLEERLRIIYIYEESLCLRLCGSRFLSWKKNWEEPFFFFYRRSTVFNSSIYCCTRLSFERGCESVCVSLCVSVVFLSVLPLWFCSHSLSTLVGILVSPLSFFSLSLSLSLFLYCHSKSRVVSIDIICLLVTYRCPFFFAYTQWDSK